MNPHFARTCALLVAEVPQLVGGKFELVSTEHLAPVSGTLVVGSVGFGGPHIRGAVTLAATPRVWESIAPDELGRPPLETAMLCDMVGELSNLVLGRFRAALLVLGVEVLCATPTTIHGDLQQLQCPCAQHSTWRAFRSAAGEIYARLDVSFDQAFSLPGPKVIEPNVEELVFF